MAKRRGWQKKRPARREVPSLDSIIKIAPSSLPFQAQQPAAVLPSQHHTHTYTLFPRSGNPTAFINRRKQRERERDLDSSPSLDEERRETILLVLPSH